MLNALSERSPAEEFVEAHRARASKEDLAYARFRATVIVLEQQAPPQLDWSAVIWSVAGCAVTAFVCFVVIF